MRCERKPRKHWSWHLLGHHERSMGLQMGVKGSMAAPAAGAGFIQTGAFGSPAPPQSSPFGGPSLFGQVSATSI